MKKNYIQPMATVVSVAVHGHILDGSPVQRINSSSAGIVYGGAGNATNGGATARTKDAGEVYNVWDDDWSQ